MAKERPKFITENLMSTEEFEYEGKRITYFVLKKEAATDFPGFLGFDGGYLYISEEVPEEFRVPQLIHEYVEFVELEGEKDRCLQASRRELEFAPKDKMEEYLEYRKDFFERLVEYYADYDDESFRNRIEESCLFFQDRAQ